MKQATHMAILALLTLAACAEDDAVAGMAQVGDRSELMDPETCKDCHPNHYKEWSSSMHAYAAEDPLFLAMNARGQRETDGDLGDFCITCHAPMAVREGATTDGLNIDEVEPHLKGITCYFCHNAVEVTGDHNSPIVLADDTTMRGPFGDPVPNKKHSASYSSLHDGGHLDSTDLCGACHDIVTPAGITLERTFQEYKESVFSKPSGFNSCNSCHMDGKDGVAADDPDAQVFQRRVHDHLWPGVDMAMTPFPEREAQRKAIECALSATVLVELCPNPDATFEVTLEANAGHRWPSGASQDRRAWVELVGYDEAGEVVYQSGLVADDEVVDKEAGEPGYDPDLWVMRDYLFDAEGNPTHSFWEVDRSADHPEGYESTTLPAATDFLTRHYERRTFRSGRMPARVEVKVRIRPVGLDVLHDLVESGDLDAKFLQEMQTLELSGSRVSWSVEDGFDCKRRSEPNTLDCPNDYRCLLNPGGPGCD